MNADQQEPIDGNKYQSFLTMLTNQAIQGGLCTPAQLIAALEVTKASVINRLFAQQAQQEQGKGGPLIVLPDFKAPPGFNGGGRQ